MRFIIIVRAHAARDAGVPPEEELAMARYHAELTRAGVLLDASALQPGDPGWRLRYEHGHRTVIDGPVAGAEARITRYALIQVRSREEALEWARRCPAPGGSAEIEVRQLCDPDEAAPPPPRDASGAAAHRVGG
ncbi:YciI family protein [Caldimonas thermodepolymerans]|uniref:YciI family protein n=1 Tax=Caldimonas thermodepolymerans TaxID=215580 RepID=UPI002236498C|nr:YciI family protein [Caldimonas thermodepolymerans]UZG46009.1 YciI family protein [Caldimonas thermodepolymerans]